MADVDRTAVAWRLAAELARARGESQAAAVVARGAAALAGAEVARVWMIDRARGYRFSGAWPEQGNEDATVPPEVPRAIVFAAPLAGWIASWTPAAAPPLSAPWQPDLALDAIVRAAVPAGLAVPSPIAGVDAPPWSVSAPLIRRYVAARLVACWPLHYGTGLATALAYVAALLSVVAVEIARRQPSTIVAGDDVVRAALAETDRLVVHLAAPDALARGLDAWAARHLDGGL